MKLFVDNLTNIDFSYLHPTRGLMGESWLAQLTLTGTLNEQGMICDFAIVKKTVREWLDRVVDHVLIVPEQLSNLDIAHEGEQVTVNWQSPNGENFTCTSPAEAITFVAGSEITETALAHWCQDQLKALFPEEVVTLELGFSAEETSGPFYHYSHGLKKHEGNCQRIAHGHRSNIQIFENDVRSPSLESEWADRWGDIYIGTQEDLKSVSEIDGAKYHTYQYQAQQGSFKLIWPQSRCYDLTTDTTVEFIAQHIAEQLKATNPQNRYQVKAFEGIGKGAIAES